MNIAIQKEACRWFDEDHLTCVDILNAEEFTNLAREGVYDFVISYATDNTMGLQLWQKIKTKRSGAKKRQYLYHNIDIQQFIQQNQQSFPASKKTVFSQALGRKTRHIIDATGGWMGDTLLMCSQNYAVSILERHWILQAFIDEACQRLAETSWLQSNQAPLPQLIKADAIDYFSQNSLVADCIYIDPMFPPKQKKSAAVRKSMQVLHELLGQDLDADALFRTAWSSDVRRIVVKRPDYAKPLNDNFPEIAPPSESLRGKLVRYDVYIR